MRPRPLDLKLDTPELQLKHAKMLEEAMMYGSRQRINPYTALLSEVQHRSGHVAWLRDQITSTLTPDLMFEMNSNGERTDHPLMKRYDRERDRLDRVCRLAIDAGIAERYVQLAELQGQTLFRVMERTLGAMNVTPEQKAAFLPALREAIAIEEQSSTAIDLMG